MTTIIFTCAAFLFLFTFQQHLVIVDAVPLSPTNCSLYREVMAGTESIRVYMGRLYNYQTALEGTSRLGNESFIASELFEGIKVIGIAGIYKHLIRKLNNDVSTKNYSGFGNKDMPGFFSEMFSDVIRDTCDWLKSYGDALTLRHIDCSNPAEQLMLTQFSIIMPLIRTFDLKFREQFNCRHRYYHHWIDENLLDTYRPEINYLQQLNGVPLS